MTTRDMIGLLTDALEHCEQLHARLPRGRHKRLGGPPTQGDNEQLALRLSVAREDLITQWMREERGSE